MKGKIAALLSVFLLINILSVPVFAETAKDDDLTRIMEQVRVKFTIPAEYNEFSSSMNGAGSDLTYRLRWSSGSYYPMANEGSVDVAVDGEGNILEYYSYRYTSGEDYQRRLPGIPKARAVDTARKYLYYLCPDIIEQIDTLSGEKYYALEYDGSYRFYFIRQYKGVPFYDNYVTVQIRGDTGELGSYSRVWTKGLKFPEPDQAIKEEQARELYKDKVGLYLTYRRTYGEDEDRTYLQYSARDMEESAGIDGVTGEKVQGRGDYSPFTNSRNNSEMYLRDAIRMRGETRLTGNELGNALDLEGLITVGEGEKLARSMDGVGIDSSCSLSGYNYSRRTGGGDYILRLDFSRVSTPEYYGKDIPDEKLKALMESGAASETINITFNAKTAELISFSTYGMYGSPESKQGYDSAAMGKATEAFIKKYKADKWGQLELLQDREKSNRFMEKYGIWGPNAYDNIIYIRKANGIPFEENWIAFNYDPQTGRLTYYNENWDDMELSSTEGVIGVEKAYEVLFRDIGLELKYIWGKPQADSGGGNMDFNNPLLVYAPNGQKPLCIDAKKGIVIHSFNGEPYRDISGAGYTDIEDHSAKEQITNLAEIGVGFGEERFRPDEVILQKDFLFLLGKMKGNIVSGTAGYGLAQRELDGMYRTLINDGTLTETEKNPDKEVTRMEGIKYLLRSLGYKKFAELKGIFFTDFLDKSEIGERDTGYAAIAKSLKLVSGDALQPNKGLTRGEAAQLIHSWLIRP